VLQGESVRLQRSQPLEPDQDIDFDYNCDGVETKLYVPTGDTCTTLLCPAPATKFQGNNGDHFCGVDGAITTCMGLGLQCNVMAGEKLPCL
jgi:hypothetical protein